MQGKIKVIGAAEAGKISSEIADSIDVLAADVMNKLLGIILDRVNAKTPVRTGYLKSQNRVEKVSALEIRALNQANYARFLEFGTSKSIPRPFMMTAVEAAKKLFPELYVSIVNDAINLSISKNTL